MKTQNTVLTREIVSEIESIFIKNQMLAQRLERHLQKISKPKTH